MVARAVVLSGSLGEGHDAVARACLQVLGDLGWRAESRDALDLLGRRSGAAGERAFRRLLGAPGVYDAFHFTQLRPGGRVALALDRIAATRAMPALSQSLGSKAPELLVSVFPTGASAAAALKARRPEVTTVVVCTDATVHRLWVHDQTDLFVVTSTVAAASVRRYRPQAAVAVVPAPVGPAFAHPPSRAQARAVLGVSDSAACVLLMGGGWGLGPLVQTATAVARAGVQVLAVAGRNRRVESRLRAVASVTPGLHPFGFTDRVPLLMAAADAVVTTPGAMTCAEARAVGRTLLLLDTVAGHGRENIQHELERGNAEVVDPAPDAVLASVLATIARGTSVAPEGGFDAWARGFAAALHSVGIEPAPARAEPAAAPDPAVGAGPRREGTWA